MKENFEEEKYQHSNQIKIKQKEKRNSGFKSSIIKEQENMNAPPSMQINSENNRVYFKDLQALRDEKESAKMRFQHASG